MTLSKFTLLTLLAVVATVIHLPPAAAQTRYVVGDTMGWQIPTAADAYVTWAFGKNFTVGDSLVFNFVTNAHDVAEVREAAYEPCTIASPINTIMAGPATVNLTTAGPHYYICTFGTHCSSGQKLMVNVSAASTASTPPPSTTMTPPSPTMTPSPSNGAPSLATVVPMALLAGVLVALF